MVEDGDWTTAEINRELVEALRGLFEHCAMVHKYWGDNSNAQEARLAIDKAQQALAQADGRD